MTFNPDAAPFRDKYLAILSELPKPSITVRPDEELAKFNPYHDEKGRFTTSDEDTGGGDTSSSVEASPDAQAVGDALNAGEHPNVDPKDVPSLMAGFADRKDDPDITELEVNGTFLFGKNGLGYAREEMPQIPDELRDKFFKDLKKEDISVEKKDVDPRDLQPIQKEVSARRAGQMFENMLKEGNADKQTIITSNDGYVLDGHHHWAASVGLAFAKPDVTIPTYEVGLAAPDLLEFALEFDKDHGIQGEDIHSDSSPKATKRLIKALLEVIEKFNPNHDELGRFASSDGEESSPYGDEKLSTSSASTGLPVSLGRMHEIEDVQWSRSESSGKEYLVVVSGDDGHIKFNAPGKGTESSVPSSQISPGDVVTHTHPSGETLSAMDVKTAVDSEVGQMRAITQDGTYFIGPPKDGWDGIDRSAVTSDIQRNGLYNPKFDPQAIADKYGLNYGFDSRVQKYNPNHDELGRFASSDSGPFGDERVSRTTISTDTIDKYTNADSSEGGCDAGGCPGAGDSATVALYGKGLDPDVLQETAEAAQEIGRQWSDSTASAGGTALQHAAAELQGQTLSSKFREPNSEKDVEAAKALLQGNRVLIDKEFPANATVTFYRGTQQQIDPSESINLNPLTSWTPDHLVAENYAGDSGTVLKVTIPVTQIAGLPKYGLGNGYENEAVLYGKNLPVQVDTSRLGHYEDDPDYLPQPGEPGGGYGIVKYNPNHDELGRFASSDSGGDGLPEDFGFSRQDYSREEIAALDSYQWSSGAVNDYLRGKDKEPLPDVEAQIKAMDSAFSSAPQYDKDTVLYRGVSASLGNKLANQSTFIDKGFVSTTDDKDEAEFFATHNETTSNGLQKGAIIELTVPAGTPHIPVDMVAGMDTGVSEQLLQRGQTYEVTGVTTQPAHQGPVFPANPTLKPDDIPEMKVIQVRMK